MKPRYGRRPGFDRFAIQVVPEDHVDPHKGPITVSCGTFTPDPVPGLREVANLAHYKGLLGYITFWDGNAGWCTIEGTATIVGPGVALTAFHVVSDLLGPIVDGRLELMLAVPTPDGGRAWRIRQITNPNGTDAALLSLSLGSRMPKSRELLQAVISIPPPQVGEQVMISGFRAAPDVVAAENSVYFPATKERILGGLRLFRAVGTVLPAADHNSTLLQIDAKTVGGMSGGAAFNSAGEYFGLLSSSIDHGEDSGTSRVLPAWQIVAADFPDYFLHPGRTLNLFDMHEVALVGRGQLSVTIHPITGFKTIELRTGRKSAIER